MIEPGKLYDQADPIAKAQERVVNKAYAEYEEKAKVLAQLHEDNGWEEPRRNEPGFKEFTVAKVAKEKARVAWQREARIHGHRFVIMDR